MSVDMFCDYIFKGNSQELAKLLEYHFSEDDFFTESLGIEYPESFSYWLPCSPKEIMDKGLTELTVRILIVKRWRYGKPDLQEDLLDEFRKQYPDLEIDMEYIGD